MRFEVKNASFSYKNDRKIFEDVNFSVDSGDIVAILGPNGAGKTTLLKCILGNIIVEVILSEHCPVNFCRNSIRGTNPSVDN